MTQKTPAHIPRIEFSGVNLAPRPMRRNQKLSLLESRRNLYERNIRGLNEDLKEGRISPQQWFNRMQNEVKDLHLSAYVIGRSGRWQDMRQKDYGHIGQTLRRQYSFLRGFRNDIINDGIENISLAKLNQRADMYGQSADQSFEEGYSAEVGLEPNVLPSYPGKGDTRCRTNCKCRWAITILNKANQDFECSWRLGSAEHCQTCIRRASEWVNLSIRNGVLIDDPAPIFYN